MNVSEIKGNFIHGNRVKARCSIYCVELTCHITYKLLCFNINTDLFKHQHRLVIEHFGQTLTVGHPDTEQL